MRIVIDLQGAQAANRQRGIGKYSLNFALALARSNKKSEIYIALNGAFYETISTIRASFDGLIPQEKILVWNAPPSNTSTGEERGGKQLRAELLREAFLSSLDPDWVVVLSHFEGQHDNAVTSIGAWRRTRTAVVLYDLIPWIHDDHYLAKEADRTWYYSKFDSLKRADLLLSISSNTCSEAIRHLGLKTDQVVNISAAADANIKRKALTDSDLRRLSVNYGLKLPFVMYTGGIDYRKNIESLIRSFANLPDTICANHQLAIVCYINDEWRDKLQSLIQETGLENDKIVFTGYVSDDDLLILYNACKLFVFPSLHEGFGLPVLEAMQCGKPVIAANLTSLPEVVGNEDALFDPYDMESITRALERGLTDEAYRQSLVDHNLIQSRKFSWEETATRAWLSLEKGLLSKTTQLTPAERKRLAFISPLPPERSGISDYSVSLLMELTRWYRIDVIVSNPKEMSNIYVQSCCGVLQVEEFRAKAGRYDRILYHFGNSELHKHMFDLLEEVPGVVVLHDFYLSAIQMWSEVHNVRFAAMTRALFAEGGYHLVAERFGLTSKAFNYDDYPASLPVIQDSLGIIVHSEFSCLLAEKWYGEAARLKMKVIPFLNRMSPESDIGRIIARQKLGLPAESFIVCSFGFVTEFKLVARLIEAWTASSLAHRADAFCFFVGDAPGKYGDQIKRELAEDPLAAQVAITGWVDEAEYRLWLDAADVAVQLRKNSRGETSASIYDCIGKGLPTIINAHGFAAEINPEAVWMLPDVFTNKNLINALETLANSKSQRQSIGQFGRNWVQSNQNSRLCAERYFDAIEIFHTRAERDFLGIAKMVSLENGMLSLDFLDALGLNSPLQPRQRKLFVDISAMIYSDGDDKKYLGERIVLRDILLSPPKGFIVEPVYAVKDKPSFRFARQFTLNFLHCPLAVGYDETVRASSGDVFISLLPDNSLIGRHDIICQYLEAHGVPIFSYSVSVQDLNSSYSLDRSLKALCEFLSRSGLPSPDIMTLAARFGELVSLAGVPGVITWIDSKGSLQGTLTQRNRSAIADSQQSAAIANPILQSPDIIGQTGGLLQGLINTLHETRSLAEIAQLVNSETGSKPIFLAGLVRPIECFFKQSEDAESDITETLPVILHEVHPIYLPYALFRPWNEERLRGNFRNEARHRLGLDCSTVLISTFGAVEAIKAPEVLIWAVDLLRSWGIPARLHFVGSPGLGHDDSTRLLSLIDSLGLSESVWLAPGVVGESVYRDHLLASSCSVQLRKQGGVGLSDVAFDPIAAGIPTVVNRAQYESFGFLPAYVSAIDDNLSPVLLAEKLHDFLKPGFEPLVVEAARDAFYELPNAAFYAARLIAELEGKRS